VLTVEFLVEPLVEGRPGPHVLAAIAAAEELGASVELGPFGSSCTVPDDLAGPVSSAVISAAFANGASHVSVRTERGPGGAGDR